MHSSYSSAILTVLVGLLLPTLSVGQTGDFSLHDSDRVTFYGDSITAQREYTEDIEEYVLTRFPAWKVSFHNAGVGGDKVSGGVAGPVDLRLERDVFVYQPTMITVMLGMNDGYYRQSEPGIISTYSQGYRHIVDSIQQHLPRARITLIQPSPFDDVTRGEQFAGGYNSVLRAYSDLIVALSKEKHTQLADFNSPVTEFLEVLNRQSPGFAQELIPDRVHPGEGGHWLMAESLLKSWNAPALVSSVSFEVSSKAATVNVNNATVGDVHRTKTGLRWTETERALPLPFPPAEVDPVVALVVKLSDIVVALDRETLQLRGLSDGTYDLLIDDRKVSEFSANQLGVGVNLATLDTPMQQQARLLASEVKARNAIESARFDIVYTSKETVSGKTAMNLANAMSAAETRLRADAQPHPHRFEVNLKNHSTSPEM